LNLAIVASELNLDVSIEYRGQYYLKNAAGIPLQLCQMDDIIIGDIRLTETRE
jgi:hypothetical protein